MIECAGWRERTHTHHRISATYRIPGHTVGARSTLHDRPKIYCTEYGLMYKGNKHGTLKPTVLRCAARSLSSKLPAWYSAKPTHRALQVALRRYMLPICPELKTSLKTDHLDLGGGLGIPSIRGSLVNTLAQGHDCLTKQYDL